MKDCKAGSMDTFVSTDDDGDSPEGIKPSSLSTYAI